MILWHDVVFLMLLHFCADFLMQTDSMALNKSTHNGWLGLHCLVYSVPFALFYGVWFALVNMVIHFGVDFFTSRATTAAWKAKRRQAFFIIIGADQLIHITTLILTFLYFYGTTS